MFSRTNAYVFQSSSCKTQDTNKHVSSFMSPRLHHPRSAWSMADTTTRALLLFSTEYHAKRKASYELSIDYRSISRHQKDYNR
jgi:hypothetical protein